MERSPSNHQGVGTIASPDALTNIKIPNFLSIHFSRNSLDRVADSIIAGPKPFEIPLRVDRHVTRLKAEITRVQFLAGEGYKIGITPISNTQKAEILAHYHTCLIDRIVLKLGGSPLEDTK